MPRDICEHVEYCEQWLEESVEHYSEALAVAKAFPEDGPALRRHRSAALRLGKAHVHLNEAWDMFEKELGD